METVAPPSIDRDQLDRETRGLRASIFRDSFIDFARYYWPRMAGMPWPENHASRALCAALQAVADGRILRLLVAIAPGIGKSTFLALYSAWRLARRPDWRAAHAMAAAADANRESLRVRRLVTHEDYQRVFPAVQLAEDEKAVQAWATTKAGRYFALGLDTTVTSKRVLELVVDDPMTAADRYSKGARDEVYTWLEESAKSRLDGDRAPIIIVAQRLDRDDIHARCMASTEHWCLLEPAAARDGRGLELRDHEGELVWADEREPDELIAPQMISHAKLRGLAKSVRITQYQQRPEEDSGGGTIARNAWRFHAPAGANPNAPRPEGCATPQESPTIRTPSSFSAFVISVDPTFGGTSNENDFCSIQVWGLALLTPEQLGFPDLDIDGDRVRCYFLLERWHERAKQRVQREAIKQKRKRYPRATILLELTAGGRGMAEDFEAEGVKNVEGEQPTSSKPARLDNASPDIEQGFVFLPIGMEDLQGFVNELAGMTVHDDDMDACSQALPFLKACPAVDARSRWKVLSS